MRFLTLAA